MPASTMVPAPAGNVSMTAFQVGRLVAPLLFILCWLWVTWRGMRLGIEWLSRSDEANAEQECRTKKPAEVMRAHLVDCQYHSQRCADACLLLFPACGVWIVLTSADRMLKSIGLAAPIVVYAANLIAKVSEMMLGGIFLVDLFAAWRARRRYFATSMLCRRRNAASSWGQLAGARRTRIPNPCDLRVYAVTDPGCNAMRGRSNAEAVRLAIDGGSTVVQLREKKIDGGAFLAEAAAVLEVCRARGVPLIINDRVDVALAVGAEGVHIGQVHCMAVSGGDLPAAAVRRMIGTEAILGVSVKTVQEALKAEADGADYLGAGAVYLTGTKESEVIGLAQLSDICKAVRIPVVSIGGVKTANAAQTIEAGCAGAAVASGIFAAENPTDACRELLTVIDATLQARQQQRQ